MASKTKVPTMIRGLTMTQPPALSLPTCPAFVPSGTFTITAGAATRTVTLPVEPATLSMTLTGAPAASDTAAKSVPAANRVPAAAPVIAATQPSRTLDVQPSSATRDHRFRVQAGAYPVAENVTIARRQLERLGYQASVTTSGTLQLVS